MTLTSGVPRLVPKVDARAAIMSDIAHEWTTIFGQTATVSTVARRWKLDAVTCAQLLDALVEWGVLSRLTDGRYRYAAHDWRGDASLAPVAALVTQD